MDIKKQVKIALATKDMSMKELTEILHKKYNRSPNSQILGRKLINDTIRYKEALEIADVLGFEITWNEKN